MNVKVIIVLLIYFVPKCYFCTSFLEYVKFDPYGKERLFYLFHGDRGTPAFSSAGNLAASQVFFFLPDRFFTVALLIWQYNNHATGVDYFEFFYWKMRDVWYNQIKSLAQVDINPDNISFVSVTKRKLVVNIFEISYE